MDSDAHLEESRATVTVGDQLADDAAQHAALATKYLREVKSTSTTLSKRQARIGQLHATLAVYYATAALREGR